MGYRLFLIVAPVAAATMALAGGLIFRHRQEAAARTLLWYVGQVALLLIVNTLELLAQSPEWTLRWASTAHLFYSFIPVSWLAFALVYIGAGWSVRSASFWLVAVLPLTTTILVYTNSTHTLIWEAVTFHRSGGYVTFMAEYGPWFWASGLYSYALIATGAVLIGRAYFRGLRLYRRQSLWIIAGVIAPFLFNLVYVFRLAGPVQKDFTPIGFALAGICFVIGMFRFRLFDIVPAARAAVLDSIDQGFLVLDSYGRIVDFNRAAAAILGLDETLVGARYDGVESVATILSGHDVAVKGSFDIQFGETSEQRSYNVAIRPFGAGTHPVGGLVMIQDITSRVRLLGEKVRLISDLEHALSEIKTLRGIIPICSVCKKVRDSEGYWHQVEAYVSDHSNAEFSHGLCEECATKLYPNLQDPE